MAIEVWVNLVEVDWDLTSSPEGRLRDRDVGAGGRADAGVGGRRGVVGNLNLLAQRLRLAADPLDQGGALLGVDQIVHRVETDKGVLAVEDAGLVDLVG